MAKYVVFLYLFKNKFKGDVIMRKRTATKKIGIGDYFWKISVALYLLTNGVLEVMKYGSGDLYFIFHEIGLANADFLMVAGIIALIAGIAVLCDLFNVEIPRLNTLIFIIAIAWAICVVVELFGWMKGGFGSGAPLWLKFKTLAIHLMVLSSLLIASGRFSKGA
jgi:hypothetical protein